LNAALNFQDKYYIYRFYEEKPGHFLLSILQNPVGETDAINKIFEVNLERAKTTEVFELIGGLIDKPI